MLTRDWSLTVSLFALSAHGVASTILLAVWNYKNVLNRFPLRLHAIVGSEVSKLEDEKWPQSWYTRAFRLLAHTIATRKVQAESCQSGDYFFCCCRFIDLLWH